MAVSGPITTIQRLRAAWREGVAVDPDDVALLAAAFSLAAQGRPLERALRLPADWRNRLRRADALAALAYLVQREASQRENARRLRSAVRRFAASSVREPDDPRAKLLNTDGSVPSEATFRRWLTETHCI